MNFLAFLLVTNLKAANLEAGAKHAALDCFTATEIVR
jgi:hypothetical protein